MRAIIGIDPGAGGGIAVFHKGIAKAVSMPKSIKDIDNYLRFLADTYERPLVFIEKVSIHRDDSKTPGMQYGIQKMLANYESLLTVIRLIGLPIVQVYPVSWQSMPGIKISRKGITKQERKNHFKSYAAKTFPECSVNLAVSDALCLIIFGTDKIHNDPQWIVDRVENIDKKELKLF